MNFKLVLKSDVNPEDVKYFLKIEEWNEDSISILMNFTTPLLISQGLERDEVYMDIINPYLFISKETGQAINLDDVKISSTIPRMVPKGVNLQ
tara:strand:+ start:310 stop:588 length:279 start_codon:yes stop_codon:yes gene_type:complete